MMSPVTALKTSEPPHDQTEWQMRVDLAAAFRLAARSDWHEAVANHFSLAMSPDGKKFLMNPRWKHFSRVRASDLMLLDAGDKSIMDRPDAPDLHVHPPYATAIASLADPDIPPIDQNTARYYNRLAIDMGYGGMANTDEEGDRLAALMGNKRVMMMGNHGVLVCGSSVAEAYDYLYYLEHACRTLVLAYQTGKPLHVMTPAVAEKTAQEWDADQDQYHAHFAEMKRILDAEDPSYAE
jgi:ribulose-5-phosphate 4-epimerase/fuculose-1-phosphate aldolase